MTYTEKLKTTDWQKVKNRIQTRDNFTCQHCGNGKNEVQVHHKYYEYGKEPWDYPDECFILLCDKCHKEAEFDKGIFNEELRSLLRSGYTYYHFWKLICGLYSDLGFDKEDRINLSSFCLNDSDLLNMAKKIITTAQNSYNAGIEREVDKNKRKEEKAQPVKKVKIIKSRDAVDESRIPIEKETSLQSLHKIRQNLNKNKDDNEFCPW